MVFTTRAKLFLKKITPSWLFRVIFFLARKTLLPFLSYVFSRRVSSFTKRMVKTVTFGDGEMFDIVIDPKNGYLDKQVYALPLYEPHIVEEFVANIRAGDVCLDVGANIGHHTIIMAKQGGISGHVYAYEPIPRIREQMEESILLNNLSTITVIADALSDSEGTMTLHINQDSIASSSFVSGGGTGIPVHVRTLDSYSYQRVNFIKIDVEGFEYPVLKGGTRLIETLKPIVLFEYSPIYYRKNNPSDSRDILAFFTEKGYELIDLEDRKKRVADIDQFASEFNEGLRSQTNLLALPKA